MDHLTVLEVAMEDRKTRNNQYCSSQIGCADTLLMQGQGIPWCRESIISQED